MCGQKEMGRGILFDVRTVFHNPLQEVKSWQSKLGTNAMSKFRLLSIYLMLFLFGLIVAGLMSEGGWL